MATAYTPLLKIAQPTQGELNGTWGTVTNENITAMFEEAIAGMATVDTWTADAHTLTEADGTTSEARSAILKLTDTTVDLTGAGDLIVPTSTKIYLVNNGAGQTITVKTSAGSGVAVADGVITTVYCDGTNVVAASTAGSTATTSAEGIVELATQAEVDTGTDTARVVTPETLTGFGGSMEDVSTLSALSVRANAVTLSGTTPTMDCDAGTYFALVMTGNTAITATNEPASGTGTTIYLILTGASTYTMSYSPNFVWAGGTPITDPGAGETDLISFTTIDNGTTWIGALVADDVS